MRFTLPPTLLALCLSGCASQHEVEKLRAQNAALQAALQNAEAQRTSLEADLAVCQSAMASARPGEASPDAEAAARALYEQISAALEANDLAAAKALTERLLSEYPETRTARSAGARIGAELAVLGKVVETPQNLVWMQGTRDSLRLERGTTLLVFWEVWCPHCKRELPELEATYQALKDRMDFVAITRITKTATEEGVFAFLAENGITYPVAREDGTVTETFAVTGIPAAAVVQDGVVVWRGHPSRLTVEYLESLL